MTNDSIVKEAEFEYVAIDITPEPGPLVVSPECCIYRVPRQLRNVNEEAYTPKLVSIRPFHHGREELKDMEMHKLRYFRDFFDRKTVVKKSKKELASIIKAKEKEIRQSYSDDCGLNSKDFVKMILLDAIFIIELFLKTRKKEKDYPWSTPCMANCIRRDLILLENQLPLFVLKELYTSGYCDSSGPSHHHEDRQITNDSFVELSKSFFPGYDFDVYSSKESKMVSFEEAKHFTHLIRHSFCRHNEIYRRYSSHRKVMNDVRILKFVPQSLTTQD